MASNMVVTTKSLNEFMSSNKAQIFAALPKHLDPDRMIRLALTAFSQSKGLQECDMKSIYASVIIAAQLGLEIGVGGQGYLIPYKGKCTFVPGWRGLVDLVSRAGRASVWTGAVFEGDEFDWRLGDDPKVTHRPKGEFDDWKKITHIYAVGRVNGSQYPVIEAWTMNRVIRHLNMYNKVGAAHYALKDSGRHMEMYARKVVLLQVLKYMPQSIEIALAADVSHAVETGQNFVIDGDFVVVDNDQPNQDAAPQPQPELPPYPEAKFKASQGNWRERVEKGVQTAQQVIDLLGSKAVLSDEQIKTIRSWEWQATNDEPIENSKEVAQ